MAAIHHVTSKDTTPIAYVRSGTGPSLIILGGALADHHFYAPLASELASHFTVYTMDRRGHGDSGDTHPYSVEREIEDLHALIEEITQPVYLYGHSAGSALALRAAASLSIAAMVLADPPYTPRGDNDDAAVAQFVEEAAHIQMLHTRGDADGSVRFFLSGLGMSEESISDLLASPAGASMMRNARALPYDYAVLGDGLVPVELAAMVTVPTLIMAPHYLADTGTSLAQVMPDARFQPLEAASNELPATALAPLVAAFFSPGN